MGKADLDVAIVRDNLEYCIGRFAKIPRPGKPDMDYCGEMAATSVLHRRCAIARLLAEADRSGFFNSLRRSAELRRDLLLWLQGMEHDERFARYICATQHRLAPFLDAIACGAFDLGKTIATLTSAPFDNRYEYEDDYLYGQLLFDLTKSEFRPSSVIPAIMNKFQEIVTEAPTARFQICQALMAGNCDDFREALSALMEEHRALFREKGDGILADPDEYATERFVLIEGLALKVIATKMGIAVNDEDRLMPKEAFLLWSP